MLQLFKLTLSFVATAEEQKIQRIHFGAAFAGIQKSFLCKGGSINCIWLFFSMMIFFRPALGSEALLIEIRGTIDPGTSHYLARAIEQAEAGKADLVLVELDTPGGLVASVREMAQSIDHSKIPVVVYTAPAGAAATSAGALLMISSHLAAMAPGSNIGAAHPVDIQGEGIKGPMDEKAVNDISAFARSMAELRKRNAVAASEVVSKSNSYTADEALKAKLIEVIAEDRSSLWKAIDQRVIQVGANQIILQTDPAPTLKALDMTIGERVLHSLAHPNIAAILMTVGILLIYAELSAPGIGLAGIFGGLCLIVAFMAFQAIPIRTGGIVLIGLGTVLILAEIFTAASGMVAAAGTVALLLGLLWVVDPTATDLHLSPWILIVIGGILILGTLAIGYGVRRIHKMSEEVLKKSGGGGMAGVQGFKGRIEHVNSDGRTGQVSIRGEIWDFLSDVPMQENDIVEVRKTEGLKLEVFPIKE
jgi:membrane-bound serine protease (ClpP class)